MFKNILVAIDVNEESSWSAALPLAAALAKQFSSKLVLATVVEDRDAVRQGQWSAIGYRRLLSTAKAKLAHLAHSLSQEITADVAVGSGSVCAGIIELARQTEADLIVLAEGRPGLRDRVIGDNASHVVERATCSVLVVRE